MGMRRIDNQEHRFFTIFNLYLHSVHARLTKYAAKM